MTCVEEIRNACKILAGRAGKKGPLGRERHKSHDGIEVDLIEIRNIDKHCNLVAQIRVTSSLLSDHYLPLGGGGLCSLQLANQSPSGRVTYFLTHIKQRDELYDHLS